MSKTADVLTNYCDDDLTFFALTYKNYDATAECLGDLRKHYAASRVILRSDGDPDPRFPILAQRNKVDFRRELRLFGIENGGAVIERMLVLFLEKPTRYLLKIDPDTVIHRRFQYLPVRSGLFGTLQTERETPSIQGGCMGFTRDAAEQILQSEMLRDSRLREPDKFINDSPYFVRMTDRANRCGLASFDWILPWIASELGIPVYPFDEVNSGWQQAPPNPNQRYAVSHPRGVIQLPG
ncbi:MAG TPA: hypothetical protein VK582_11060 [Pyrinomonadaceae bacterium]|nr:hypothetical protein [Pyrinomonadaceae bacterium]